MKLKLNDQGHVVVQDGLPVYTHEDGQDRPFDAASTVKKITQLNGEAKGHRERAETAEAALKVFDGLDPAAARQALDTIKNLDDKKLIDAGEVEKIKSEAKAAYDQQLQLLEAKHKPVATERDNLRGELTALTISNAFNGSSFIKDKVAVPADLVKSHFGGAFKVEGSAVVGYDAAGNKIYSLEKPGEIASFDEALSIAISGSPLRDHILKGSVGSGGGAGGSGGGAGGGKTTSRAQFDAMPALDRSAFVMSGGTVHD